MQSYISFRRAAGNITFPGDGKEDILKDIAKVSQFEQVSMGSSTPEVVDGVIIHLYLMVEVSLYLRSAWPRSTLLIIVFLFENLSPPRTTIFSGT